MSGNLYIRLHLAQMVSIWQADRWINPCTYDLEFYDKVDVHDIANVTLGDHIDVLMVVAKDYVGKHMPPWRWIEYVRAKWFSSYGRTIDDMLAEEGVV
ncbi:hypothetical protein BHM03_00004417 [Ensete ventricosum]|nr:hypothetical protein BHM03_00004417 [Ensete ventricosum]